MSLDEALLEGEEIMEKAVNYMAQEFASIRTGKASPALVDNIDVEVYGSSMKLKQLALITTPEPRLIVIQPFDVSTVKDIERAISESRLGINPSTEGKLIRLPIPELSEERRKDLVRTLKQIAEDSRVRVRSGRRQAMDALKKLQKEGGITEDDLRLAEKQVQELTDKYTASIEGQLVKKEEEVMKV